MLGFSGGSETNAGEADPWVRKDSLEKEMATDSSLLAWEIPWTEESGGLQSIGLQRVQTGLSDSTTTVANSCYSRKRGSLATS